MKRTLIHNAFIVNEGTTVQGSIVIENGVITEILTHGKPLSAECDEIIDATEIGRASCRERVCQYVETYTVGVA